MAMTRKFDVVATLGEYTNSAGEAKKRYQKVGVVMESDEGRLSMKLDMLPVTKEWSGWLSFYDADTNSKAGGQRERTATTVEPNTGEADIDEDVPF
jgi:hypothetical protein